MNSGPGTGPAGRRLLAALDRLITDEVTVVAALPDHRGNYQLEGRGHAYKWQTFVRLADAGMVKATFTDDGYVLRLTEAGRKLLGA